MQSIGPLPASFITASHQRAKILLIFCYSTQRDPIHAEINDNRIYKGILHTKKIFKRSEETPRRNVSVGAKASSSQRHDTPGDF